MGPGSLPSTVRPDPTKGVSDCCVVLTDEHGVATARVAEDEDHTAPAG